MPRNVCLAEAHVDHKVLKRHFVLRLGVVRCSFLYRDQTLLTHPVLWTHRLPGPFANEKVKLRLL